MANETRPFRAEEVLEHVSFLSRLARELVGDPHNAADLVQETLTVALQQPPRDGRSLRSWLAVVAANLTHVARRRKTRRVSREESVARHERFEIEPSLDRIEVQRALFDFVMRLPDEQRMAVYLRYYEQLTPTAIGKRLGVPVKTVKTRHTRALAELRRRLDEGAGGDRSRWMSALLPLARRGITPYGDTGFSLKAVGTCGIMLVIVTAFVAAFAWRGSRDGGTSRSAEATFDSSQDPAASEEITAPNGTTTREDVDRSAPLSTTGALIVKLRWADKTPAGGIALSAWCSQSSLPRQERFSSQTDAAGIASFGALFPGEVRLELDRGDVFWGEVLTGTTRSIEHTIPECVDVDGMVVDLQGEPVAAAEIWSQALSSWPNGMRLATAGSDGRFRVNLMLRKGNLCARDRNHLPSALFSVDSLSIGSNGTRTVTLRLGENGGRVEGSVTDPDGHPVVGAVVHGGPLRGKYLGSSDGPAGMEPCPGTVETDDSGWFELPDGLPWGRQPIVVVGRGFPAWHGEVEVQDKLNRVWIQLARPATVTGRVLFADGQPGIGVLVEAGHKEPGTWGASSLYSNATPPCRTRTDEGGRFMLGLLPPGRCELRARDDDPQPPDRGRGTAIVNCIGGEVVNCDLHLGDGRTITGRVIDASGRPLSGWLVRSAREGASLDEWFEASFQANRTDAQGQFSLVNCEDGRHTLSVHPPDGDPFVRGQAAGVVPGAESVIIVVDNPSPLKGRLRGSFLDANGLVPREFRLECRALLAAGSPAGSSVQVEFDSLTGAFEEEAPTGSYSLVASLEGDIFAVSPQFVVVENASTDIGMFYVPMPGRISVTVRGAEQEIEALRWGLLGRQVSQGYLYKDLKVVNGNLESGDLSPGEWQVVCSTRDVRPKNLFIRDAKIKLAAGEAKYLVMQAAPGLELALHCRAAFKEVLFEAFDAAGSLIDRGEVELSEGGQYRILLPEGMTTLHLSTASGLRGQLQVDIGPGLEELLPIEFDLR